MFLFYQHALDFSLILKLEYWLPFFKLLYLRFLYLLVWRCFPPHCMGHLVLAKAVRRLTEYDYCIVRWGFEDIELLHAFDYVKGTPAMVTWVVQSVFLFGFNASVWLLFRGLGMVCSMCSGNERKVKSN